MTLTKPGMRITMMNLGMASKGFMNMLPAHQIIKPAHFSTNSKGQCFSQISSPYHLSNVVHQFCTHPTNVCWSENSARDTPQWWILFSEHSQCNYIVIYLFADMQVLQLTPCYQRPALPQPTLWDNFQL